MRDKDHIDKYYTPQLTFIKVFWRKRMDPMKVFKIIEDYNRPRKAEDRKLKNLHDAVQMFEIIGDDDDFYDSIKVLYKP